MNTEHDQSRLASYDAGLLADEDASLVEEHLTDCAACREELAELRRVDAVLDPLPPEMLIDGPPDDADRALVGSIATVRTERARRIRTPPRLLRSAPGGRGLPRRPIVHPGDRPPRGLLLAAAAVVILVVAGATGWAIGRSSARLADEPFLSAVLGVPTGAPGDTSVITGQDPVTGARLGGAVLARGQWVALRVAVAGVPEGRSLSLVVVDRTGARFVAASWVSTTGDLVDGSAAVRAGDIAAVVVETRAGEQLIIAKP